MAVQRQDGIRQLFFADQRIGLRFIITLVGEQFPQLTAQLLALGQRTDRRRHDRHRARQIIKADDADDLLCDVRLHGDILTIRRDDDVDLAAVLRRRKIQTCEHIHHRRIAELRSQQLVDPVDVHIERLWFHFPFC